MKVVTLIFYAFDGEAAASHAKDIRRTDNPAYLRDASALEGEAEKCDRVIVMPDVPNHLRRKIETIYGDRAEERKAKAAEPAPAIPTASMDAPGLLTADDASRDLGRRARRGENV